MSVPFKHYLSDYSQHQLFSSNVFDLLPNDHDCFVYRDLFAHLDTSEVDAQFSRLGQRAYAPLQIVSILIYAYSHGVFSSRQIEKRCNEDLGFMLIAGKRCSNFRVLGDFRKVHGDFFRSCFKQTVAMALELDMVSPGHVSLDGSKFKANSSRHKAMSYGRMKERMSRPESRGIYGRRKAIVEPVFGQIRNTGFRGFGVRGKSRVAGEFSLVCAAHNVKKLVRAALSGVVRLEFGQVAAMG